MDAVFFVILISIAVTALSHTAEEDENIPDTADILDQVMSSQVRLGDLGYPDGDRVMKITDVWALSLTAGDGKVSEIVRKCLDAMFPWEDSYGLTVVYMNKTQTMGNVTDGWSECVHREYDAEFGGTLEVTFCCYL